MTGKEFKQIAIEIINNERIDYLCMLFDYEEIDQIKVAQVDDNENAVATMPFTDFIDELYEQIKEKLC